MPAEKRWNIGMGMGGYVNDDDRHCRRRHRGHLYPAIALAREFLRRDSSTKILFVGTSRGVESRVLTHEDSSSL